MRYPASEKLEIIRLVEESHLSARLTLAKLGIPRTTFYRWYDRYLQRGEAGLQDQSPKPKCAMLKACQKTKLYWRVVLCLKLSGQILKGGGGFQHPTSKTKAALLFLLLSIFRSINLRDA